MLLAGVDLTWLVTAIVAGTMAYLSSVAVDRLAKHFQRFMPQGKLQQQAWLVEPVSEADLPAKVVAHFNRHTPEFEQLGFSHLADYLLLRAPEVSAVRQLQSSDGQLIAEITALHGQLTYSCVSIATNGAYLETGRGWMIPTRTKEQRLVVFRAPGKDAITLVEHHRQCVRDYATEQQTELIALEVEDLPEMLRYAQKLVAQALLKDGVIDMLPEFVQAKC